MIDRYEMGGMDAVLILSSLERLSHVETSYLVGQKSEVFSSFQLEFIRYCLKYNPVGR